MTGDAAIPRWFPSSPHRRIARHGAELGWMLVGEVHARQVGSSTSACGVFVLDWPMLFDRAFSLSDASSCPECIKAVTRATAHLPAPPT